MAKGRLRRRVRRFDRSLTDMPVHAITDRVQIPTETVSPARRITVRVIYALAALFAAVLIVYIDRDGYRDSQENQLSFLDCLYYATVSLSTTGYGDITPITPTARLVNVLVITPLRVAFLIVLIGTTVETLTTQSRQVYQIQRWRSRLRNHIIIVGYGTKGRTAAAAMVGDEVAPADIVVVDEVSPRWSAPRVPAWSPCAAARPTPRCCGWPAPSTPSRSSSPPTGTTPPCW